MQFSDFTNVEPGLLFRSVSERLVACKKFEEALHVMDTFIIGLTVDRFAAIPHCEGKTRGDGGINALRARRGGGQW